MIRPAQSRDYVLARRVRGKLPGVCIVTPLTGDSGGMTMVASAATLWRALHTLARFNSAPVGGIVTDIAERLVSHGALARLFLENVG